jgi:exosome complex RNA-binding protein Rrp42 (RNase PH superfamily)
MIATTTGVAGIKTLTFEVDTAARVLYVDGEVIDDSGNLIEIKETLSIGGST